jgi:hypothetical protein
MRLQNAITLVQIQPMPPFNETMGYDYIHTQTIDVQLDNPCQLKPILPAIKDIVQNTRQLLTLHVSRDKVDMTKFHITWQNLEHGVTY